MTGNFKNAGAVSRGGRRSRAWTAFVVAFVLLAAAPPAQAEKRIGQPG